MKYSFIVNPKAGNGRIEKLIAKLTSKIAIHQLDAEILVSQKPGHAIELASLSKGEIVIAVGGDGTVNEVANGIVGSSKVLAIIPSGSGNDMIKSLAIPNDFSGAFDFLLGGKTISMDCATVQYDDSPARYFLNCAGVGFDAAVAQRSLSITYLTGTLRYVVAVMQTLGKYKSPAYTIRLDSKTSVSKNLLIAIGNGCCAGGGFYLTPEAQVDDGHLDVCMIAELSISEILQIMPKVMKGKHTSNDKVKIERVKSISIDSNEPFYVHADGEIMGRVNSVVVSVIEKGIRVISGF